jgi:hypothetical protein
LIDQVFVQELFSRASLACIGHRCYGMHAAI